MKESTSYHPLTTLPGNWKESDQLLLLNFGQEGNGASMIVQTYVSEIWEQFKEAVICYELDAHAHQGWLDSLRIYQYPTLMIFHRGKILASFSGIFPKHKLEASIQTFLNDAQPRIQ